MLSVVFISRLSNSTIRHLQVKRQFRVGDMSWIILLLQVKVCVPIVHPTSTSSNRLTIIGITSWCKWFYVQSARHVRSTVNTFKSRHKSKFCLLIPYKQRMACPDSVYPNATETEPYFLFSKVLQHITQKRNLISIYDDPVDDGDQWRHTIEIITSTKQQIKITLKCMCVSKCCHA